MNTDFETQTETNETFREIAANIMAEYTEAGFLDLDECDFDGELVQ